jgi:predicted phage tail protein
VIGVYTGTYTARVRSRNAVGDASIWRYSSVTDVVGKTAPPPTVTLSATGGQLEIVLNWVFPTASNIDDTSYTEIWVSETSTFSDGHSQGTYAYPINTVTVTGLLPDKQLWFWARLVDKSNNVGAWSTPPATAIGGSVTDLFQPVQDQLDTILKEYFPLFAGDPAAAAASGAVQAGVWSQVTNRQDADLTMEQTVQLIGAKTPDGQAFILNANTVKVSDTETLAQKLDTVAVDLGPLEASVTTLASAQASTQGQLDASYTLGIDVNGYVSGFVAQNTGSVSNFIIVADNFQIVKPTGGARTEFSSGNWRVYDSAGTLRVRLGVW